MNSQRQEVYHVSNYFISIYMHQSEQNYILSNVEGFIYYRAKTFRSCLFLLTQLLGFFLNLLI